MDPRKAPFIRVGIAVAVIAMLLYLPSREFLKTTFMIGMPFVLVLIIMKRWERKTLPWLICLLLLTGIAGSYIYLLTGLPERIATRSIIIEGTGLVAEGRFDEATETFSCLEQYGKTEEMDKRLGIVAAEKSAATALQQAQSLIQAGREDEAAELLKTIPTNTRAYPEAREIIKEIDKR